MLWWRLEGSEYWATGGAWGYVRMYVCMYFANLKISFFFPHFTYCTCKLCVRIRHHRVHLIASEKLKWEKKPLRVQYTTAESTKLYCTDPIGGYTSRRTGTREYHCVESIMVFGSRCINELISRAINDIIYNFVH